MHIALAMLLLCSCRKVDDLVIPNDPTDPSSVSEPGTTRQVENLGHIFTGSYITWRIHPLDPNNSPLFTYQPNTNSGYCMLMIDNGKVNGRTPINSIHFVVVDLQTFTSKVVNVTNTEGGPITGSVGKVVRWIFGMDKNFYVATEASSGGGGHLIRYNPNTQVATDLGKPFSTPAGDLDIYTLNTGTDGALYGGSFGGDGQVYTFRYDYSNPFEVDVTPLDNTSRYVTAISGDSRYTYAVCGKNNWFLYAIDRQTGTKKTLKCNMGPATAMTIFSHTDAPYAQSAATYIRLNGFDCSPLPEYHRPSTSRVEFAPYDPNDPRVPKVSWDMAGSRVAYKLSSGETGYVNVNGLEEDIYPSSGPAVLAGNKVYVSCDKQGILGAFTPGIGFEKIGSSSLQINAMTAPPSGTGDAGKLYMGGYPKGLFYEYDPLTNWSLNTADLTMPSTNGFGSGLSNPSQRAMFQNADASGVYGSMNLLSLAYTKNGYIAGAGNNDRITSSSGRELSMSSYRNGTVRNYYQPEFANYDFMSMCVSKDSNYTFVCGYSQNGGNAKIFKYDPVGNRVTGSWELPLWGDRTTAIQMFSDDLLVGFCLDAVYLFDLNSGSIIWKQELGSGQRIYSMTIGPDNAVYATHLFQNVMKFRITKFNIDAADKNNIRSTATAIAEFEDADHNEMFKPAGLLVGPGLVPGSSELYITGLPSFYKVSL